MLHLSELLAERAVVPFIRQSDFAQRKPWYMPERRLLDYLLIYIQEGQCLFHIDGEEYRFGGGEFCLIQPNSVHDLRGLSDTRTPFVHMDIFYHPERESSFPTKAGQLDLSAYSHLMQPRLNDLYGIHIPVRLTPRSPLKFRDTFLKMVECWQNREPLLQLRAQSLATELVLYLLEDYGQPSGGGQYGSVPPSLQWISSYLSFHLMAPLSVQDMAKRASLSLSRFSALFKLQFGVPPHRYLLLMRIGHAKELLVSSDFTQEEIASFCGFADVHHFSKAFRKEVGTSPGSFRQTSRFPGI
ncbi:AraC family transcriptional regulator [Paenibacillus eucommiae]|uniref:AraC-like DNA-binding protein n=1 Tax=Paenibacillus eucommiae TaxID=1355755 RepID=A0ABS4J5C8_9BACL|nr:AraC family transcriptional regulator [Paenibacillus eucommiae]MBP1995033.1 AraC-like DNA-binding protein [Paenibacillus eucommiae]